MVGILDLTLSEYSVKKWSMVVEIVMSQNIGLLQVGWGISLSMSVLNPWNFSQNGLILFIFVLNVHHRILLFNATSLCVCEGNRHVKSHARADAKHNSYTARPND